MITRRRACLLAALALGLAGPVLAQEAHPEAHQEAHSPIKAVFDLGEGLEQASRAIANIRNELAIEPDAKIVVVAHGEGVKFLLEGATDSHDRPYAAMVAALSKQGVEFRVCNNTLNNFHIAPERVIPEARIVPAGIAEVLRLQAREGYVYFKP
ncbi:MAG: DsrE family protein [Burkholderiaceae bacterium]|nr:DsrE family protein [Burkholderiaceae bacterium]